MVGLKHYLVQSITLQDELDSVPAKSRFYTVKKARTSLKIVSHPIDMANPQTDLNVIGLISGGKDSFFSLLHCLANNHRIVALANLYPLDSPRRADGKLRTTPQSETCSITISKHERNLSTEDLNSFMYQTAGHALIPLYVDALDLPLYRQEILGSAKDSSKYYGADNEDVVAGGGSSQQGDETESLMPLLRQVMAAHPEANAVCSGAILSTYQRTRIESVALRLGLVPLSYLWQYPVLPPPSPGGLLDDMAAVGFDVRIVKVASGGLDDSLLWENLLNPLVRRRVEKGVGRFGGSILGEGGEYETLVVDGPPGVWKGRIEVDETQMRKSMEEGFGAVSWMGFDKASGRMEKREIQANSDDWKGRLRNIGVWDEGFATLLGRLCSKELKWWDAKLHHSTDEDRADDAQDNCSIRPCKSNLGDTFNISNMTSPESGSDASGQMMGIAQKILTFLEKEANRSACDIVFTTILLQSMSDFKIVNEIYGKLFQAPKPPARVTVGCPLPVGVRVMVSIVVHLGDRTAREGLHVQSRSYWAPANIGPYSQAICTPLDEAAGPSLVYIAGQIPLVPATMELIRPEAGLEEDPIQSALRNFHRQASLSLQHLWRIGVEMDVRWWTGAIAFITGETNLKAKAITAWEAWNLVHEKTIWEKDDDDADDEDGLDAWDIKYGGLGTLSTDCSETYRLPDFSAVTLNGTTNPSSPCVPAFLAVQVNELPRNCDIEWQSLGIAHSAVRLTTHTFPSGLQANDCCVPTANRTVSYIGIPSQPTHPTQDLVIKFREVAHWASEMAFQRNGKVQPIHMTIYTPYMALAADFDAQIIPCRRIWGAEGVELAAGVVVHSGRRSGEI